MVSYVRSVVERLSRMFDKHRPKLCAQCGRPMSVKEKRAGDLCFKCKQLAELEAIWNVSHYPKPSRH